MVPLREAYTYLDLARAIGLPIVIIARPSLGTINHTLLTVEALRRSGLKPAGVVINYAQEGTSGLAERTNPGVIERMAGVPIWGVVAHGVRRFDALVDHLKPGAF